jgi:DNA-binding transcriptional MerR regulator
MSEPFLSINEVSKQIDVPAHTLRYWEKQFPAAVKPATGAGGRRYYRPDTIAALEQIKHLLYKKGMTISGVKKMIKDGEFKAEKPTAVKTKAAKSAKTNDASLFNYDPANGNVPRALELLKLALKSLK